MIAIHPDLLTILDAVEIRSPTRFSLRGETRDITTTSPNDAAIYAADTKPLSLVATLQEDLYERLYLRPTAPHMLTTRDPPAERELVAALSAANSGRGTWEPGWIVERLDEQGRVAVTNDGITFWTQPAGLRTRDGEIRQGQDCRMRVGKELRNWMAGFYFAIGNGSGDEDDDETGDETERLVRYYWHLTIGAAVPFMKAATELLNATGIPFRLKVLVEPDAYRRADAGVLYLRRRYDGHLGDTIAQIHDRVALKLRPEVPLFTKKLAGGLGLAEDPGGSLSFGEHRCKLAATALWRSFLRAESDREARAATIAAVFEEEGLDPMRPHLGRRGEDDDTLRPPAAGPRPLARSVWAGVSGSYAAASNPASASLISPRDAAIRIGQTLCREAIWDVTGRLCNWMGRPSPSDARGAGPNGLTSAALGPDLYAGSAGVALFLAQLHALTDDDVCNRTALGAIARSIRQLDRSPPTGPASPLAFFLGHLGVAYAARRVGALIGQDDLDAHVESILDRVAESTSAPHLLDVNGGNAGAIPVLLALGQTPGLESCHGLAIALGEELCLSAIRQGNACIWEPDSATGPGAAAAPLTGLSHGAAGIGLALFELHAATGRIEFLETARGAFAYEDSLFDAQRNNWPDLRTPEPSDRSNARPHFAVAWCHGAPGIALSRLRAAALDPARSQDYLASARCAIATTLVAIDENFQYPRSDATLCHGLSGLGEVILIASQLLDEPSYHSRAVALAEALIDRHASSGDWPSGVPSGGPNPSLMLGLAGIGYWLLRLHDPAKVPPFLLLIP